MSKTRVWITMGCCLFAVTLTALAQSARKPGLWEVTTTMNLGGQQMPAMQMPQNMQLPPGVQLPPGMQMPQGGGGSPFGGPRTMKVCITQAMIDKFGGPSPSMPNRNANCQMTDISIKADGMTAKMVCTGQMNATGTVESTFVDANTTSTKMHITGTMQMGPNSRPVDMSMQATAAYKGPDCGDVKPLTMPSN